MTVTLFAVYEQGATSVLTGTVPVPYCTGTVPVRSIDLHVTSAALKISSFIVRPQLGAANGAIGGSLGQVKSEHLQRDTIS